MDKCGNESETANWILANTKKCPVCTVRIEKNQVGADGGRCRSRMPLVACVPHLKLRRSCRDLAARAAASAHPGLQGCNHMVCRNKGCRFEFCW